MLQSGYHESRAAVRACQKDRRGNVPNFCVRLSDANRQGAVCQQQMPWHSLSTLPFSGRGHRRYNAFPPRLLMVHIDHRAAGPIIMLFATLFALSSVPSDICSRYETERDCLYAPEPRCSWETSAAPSSSCVCATESCEPVDLCVLVADTPEACDKASLPNGASCVWNSTAPQPHCTCRDPNCTTVQPSCTVDVHCDDDCAWPCECAAGHCYLVDECWRFDGPMCAESMLHGRKCCEGKSTGSDKGCFLCEQSVLCKKDPTSTPIVGQAIAHALPLRLPKPRAV